MTIQSVKVRTIFRFAPRDARTGGALSGPVYCYIALDRQAKLDWPFYSPTLGILRIFRRAWGRLEDLVYIAPVGMVLVADAGRTREGRSGKIGRFVPSDARFPTTGKVAGKCWYF